MTETTPTPTQRQTIEQLVRQAERESNPAMAKEAIAAADALATSLNPHAAISLLLFNLRLRATWGVDFVDAFQSTVLTLESSPMSDFDKKGHRRAIAAVVRRNVAAHPALQDWLDNADLVVTRAELDANKAAGPVTNEKTDEIIELELAAMTVLRALPKDSTYEGFRAAFGAYLATAYKHDELTVEQALLDLDRGEIELPQSLPFVRPPLPPRPKA